MLGIDTGFGTGRSNGEMDGDGEGVRRFTGGGGGGGLPSNPEAEVMDETDPDGECECARRSEDEELVRRCLLSDAACCWCKFDKALGRPGTHEGSKYVLAGLDGGESDSCSVESFSKRERSDETRGGGADSTAVSSESDIVVAEDVNRTC